ncbi:MAG: peptide deformylase [Clostridia bacterium]|jgi:peptide deformylase|nr:peptide deformylase [Clostridia bacterium]
MAILNIVKDGDEILRKKSKPVDKIDERILTLLDDMKETMEKAGGVGLAAVQIGKLKQVIVIDTGEDQLELINPKLLSAKGEQEDLEGCLSCPGKWGIRKRPLKVEVETLTREGKTVRKKAEGFLAKAICHEMDHLQGKLFYDEDCRILSPEEMKDYE